jgi:hypothetical protein
MTARQVYEGVLIELNKVQAPSLLLEDFNYLFNKAIYQYVNKKYNVYDVNQQTTDDVSVLKSSVILEPIKPSKYNKEGGMWNKKDGTDKVVRRNALLGAVYEFALPMDYLHLLNCVCNFKVNKTFKCYNKGDYVQFAAKRLTADAWSQIINNFYMRPMYKRPYYYIHNINTNSVIPTDPIENENPNQNKTFGRDMNGEYEVTAPEGTGTIDIKTNFPRNISIEGIEGDVSLVEKPAAHRIANPTTVRLEIRYGKDNSLFELTDIMVDYIKAPQHIRLTQEQLDLTEDTSQIMEFPDYICQEIINELVTIVMENSGDQILTSRMPNHQAVSTSIANPAQA